MSILVLSLDTSTPWMSAALLAWEPGRCRVLATREAGPPQVVSTLVPSVFDELLAEAGRTKSELRALVVGSGPGLFTGVRVAMASLKSVAYGLRIPLLCAGSLEAMALAAARGGPARRGGVFEEPGASATGVFYPVLDARKGEVYFAAYRVDGLCVTETRPPEAASPARFVETLAQSQEPVTVFGSGLKPVGPLPPGTRTLEGPLGPYAAELAALALLKTPEPVFDAASVLALEPFYLRPPEAELARKRREAAT